MTDIEIVETVLLSLDCEERLRKFQQDWRLRRILPEVYALDGVPQPPEFHPEGDVLTHTLLAVRQLPPAPDRRLAWAVLLHDVGKAATTCEVEGRIRSFNHDRVGAKIATAILERLGMETDIAADIVWLIGHHMFALSWQADSHDRLSRRQRRFIEDDRFPLLLSLLEIDALAAGSRREKMAQIAFYREARARVDKKEL